ncbi:MAG: hypothetical protein P0Y53_17540 [Candidatus Pseudobacter hemicellulosilyticus]|uniref:Uncharacterized protein n=1 Tax=Candidatus Pseudobacter hemicellulosilyticus TaxID=3121375 RepID=A0AAJ5WRA1_9BACT|nr:MAG: hypothetical protein P0Y53_17540 [Pseudobacter sp.]
MAKIRKILIFKSILPQDIVHAESRHRQTAYGPVLRHDQATNMYNVFKIGGEPINPLQSGRLRVQTLSPGGILSGISPGSTPTVSMLLMSCGYHFLHNLLVLYIRHNSAVAQAIVFIIQTYKNRNL